MNTLMKIAAGMLLLVVAAGCCHCRALKKSRLPLIGTEWQLVQLGGESISPSDDAYNILFGEDGRISGIGACNRLMGGYTTGEKGSLKIGPLASTRMACPGMDKEVVFMQAIESATRYDMDGEMLLLLDGETLKAVLQAKKQ